MLSSSIALSQLLAAEHKTTSLGNVNFIEPSDGGGNVVVCYMPYLHPFSTGDGTPSNAVGQYEGLAAIFLAMEHLNTGNGTIVSEWVFYWYILAKEIIFVRIYTYDVNVYSITYVYFYTIPIIVVDSAASTNAAL